MSINQQMSDMTALRSRRFLLGTDFVVSFLLLVATVIIFRITNLDITIQKIFYLPPTGWYLKDLPIFSLLYHYGNLPALIIAIAGLVLFGLGYRAMKWEKWRKIGIFLVLVMVIGPGLIINTSLKDNWGRPRPRNVTDFGGKYNYEKVLSVDTDSPGKSFPCGHASMGFYLFTPWFLLRRRKSAWAYLSLASGIILGLLIGTARVAQGGHWVSDVIISGIIVYMTGLLLFRYLKLDRSVWFYPKNIQVRSVRSNLVGIIVLLVICLLIFAVFLATPYSDKKAFVSHYYSNPGWHSRTVIIDIPVADFIIDNTEKTDSLKIVASTRGFGFPGSKLVSKFSEQPDSNALNVTFIQTKKGWFTELENTIRISYPYIGNNRLDIHIGKGSGPIIIPENIRKLDLKITVDEGSLAILLPKTFKPRITTLGDFKLIDKTGFTSSDSIFINEDFKLEIIVRKGELTLY